MLPIVVITAFMCAGIVFLLWCLAHFIHDGLRFSNRIAMEMKIASFRAQSRKVISISSGAPHRSRYADARISEAVNATTHQDQDFASPNWRFRNSL